MEIRRQVEDILETRIRPMLRSHGGEVRLADYRDGVVLVELLGACSGCPCADLSTCGMIEDVLRSALPEVVRVELDRSVSPELLDFARAILKPGEGRTQP